MKTFSTKDNVITGGFVPAYLVVDKKAINTLNFKKKDIFTEFEAARNEAKCRGNSFVIRANYKVK